MAENIIETRILLRYATYQQWMNSRVILQVGEAAVAAFPSSRVIDGLSNSRPENTPPAIGIKIGDGQSYFYQLPWVQAVAADVYSWAKASYKPTYTAEEISGLQSFVENLVSGDTEVTIAPRIYQLYEGTDDNAHKFYLRYKENNEESNWIIDTSTYIDLNDLVELKAWMGSQYVNYPNLGTATGTQTLNFINNLNYSDEERENYFVTSVSEKAGIISTSRAQPSFSNLSGVASVGQGGTGKTELPSNEVLVGNGANTIQTIPIAEEIANNTHLVPNYLIKQYVDKVVEGLSGAMHFIGESTVVINPNTAVNPNIPGYDFSKAQPGDVILYNSKEYVWTGVNWRLLGDETSYAVKGSIKDADIDPDAAIQQSKIANLDQTLDAKVDKVEGKDLSSNDYTNEDKQKLANIEENAQQNIIEHIFLNDNEIRATTVQNTDKSINLQISEFDEASRQKLSTIQEGAQVNRIERIIYDEEEIIPNENKILTITSNPHKEHENKIEVIKLNGIEQVPNSEKEVNITLDQAALNLNVLEGAQTPGPNNTKIEVEQIQKKLQLATIAVSGDVKDLQQTSNTYIILNCGSSTELV